MKKAFILAAAAAMMLTACSEADSNTSKDRTTTATKEAAVSEETSSEAETATTTTAAPQNSSESETQTQQTSVTTTTAADSSEPDSSQEDDMPQTDIRCDSKRIASADFGVDISYPDGWEVKGYEIKNDKPSQTVAMVSNDDLGVSSTVELINFEDSIKVSGEEYLEKLSQVYTELTTPDEGDPMSVSDVEMTEGSAGDAKTIFISYTQRGVKSYIYTFVFENKNSDNSFLQFSYAFSESDNTEHIKTALSDMMSK